MQFIRTEIPDVLLCQPDIIADSRGYFVETFCEDELTLFLGYKINFCQDNESKSNFGTLRGLHYQLPPFAQTKLVRVIEGVVLDIVIDIRKGSPTFGKHISVELSGKNKTQVLVPRGFAHGFIVLSQTATFAYKVDNSYSAENERGIAFDDTELNLDWKLSIDKIQLSKKDRNQIEFLKAEYFDYKVDLYE